MFITTTAQILEYTKGPGKIWTGFVEFLATQARAENREWNGVTLHVYYGLSSFAQQNLLKANNSTECVYRSTMQLLLLGVLR